MIAFKRALVTGGVNTGKSALAPALAAALGAPHPRYTDEAIVRNGEIVRSWQEPNEEVAAWMAEPGPWVIAGVRVPWALLLWRPVEPPPVIYLTRALSLETHSQNKMTRAVESGWRLCEAELGIKPLYRGPYTPTLVEEIVR